MSDKLNQLIELLKLEKIDDLIFRGACEDLGFRQVFGGQVVRSISFCRDASCATWTHSPFLPCLLFSTGDSQYPIIYDVETLREGRNFSAFTRKSDSA